MIYFAPVYYERIFKQFKLFCFADLKKKLLSFI